MKKIMSVVAAAVLAGGIVVGVGVTHASASPSGWEATDGIFSKKTSAKNEIKRLEAKKFTGYATEHERSKSNGRTTHHYEVFKEFKTQSAAQAEVNALHTNGFTGAAVEDSRTDD